MDIIEIHGIQEEEAFRKAFDSWLNSRWRKIGYGHLTGGEKRVIRLNSFIMEVNGNGFDGFLLNSTGDWTHEIYDDLVFIDARKTGNLLKRAIDLFPRGVVPTDTASRRSLLSDLERDKKTKRVFDRINTRFYELDDGLPAKIWRYIRQHKDHFIAPSEE